MDINYNGEYDNIIRDMVERYPRSYFKKLKAKCNKYLFDYINECTPMLNAKYYLISTKTYWVLNKIKEFPKCVSCGKELRQNIKINDGYPKHCSKSCSSSDPITRKHITEAFERKYGKGIVNPFQTDEVIRKISETNLKKYGVTTFTQTQEYKNIIHRKKNETEIKKYKTHKMNNSFHTSSFEKIVFYILQDKYKDVIYQYKSEEYPFNCDFFIPSENLYIEYNGIWTHGGHYYDNTSETDRKKVEYWKSKNKGFYKNAIYTWTDLDLRKRDIAMKNNLNYKVLWDMNEVYEFVYPGYFNFNDSDRPVIEYNSKMISREIEYYKNHEIASIDSYITKRNFIESFFNNKCLNITFSPLLLKYIVKKYNINRLYDISGGYGNRIMGSFELDGYYVSYKNKDIAKSAERMKNFFNFTNVYIVNDKEFDSVLSLCDSIFVDLRECVLNYDNILRKFEEHRNLKYMIVVSNEKLNTKTIESIEIDGFILNIISKECTHAI